MSLIEEARQIVKLCEHPEMSRSLLTEQYRFAKALLAADEIVRDARNRLVHDPHTAGLVYVYEATLKE